MTTDYRVSRTMEEAFGPGATLYIEPPCRIWPRVAPWVLTFLLPIWIGAISWAIQQ
jgi:hypothetical protein